MQMKLFSMYSFPLRRFRIYLFMLAGILTAELLILGTSKMAQTLPETNEAFLLPDPLFKTRDMRQQVYYLHLKEPEGRQHLWSKMVASMRHIYQFRDDYDFFFKADDDSFVILENLRHTLLDYDPDEPIMMGYPFYHILSEGHVSGGAGYLLSRETLKRLVEKAIGKHPNCPTYDQDLEDVKVSMCAYAVGVRLVHVIDRHTTFPYPWRDELLNDYRFQRNNFDRMVKQIVRANNSTGFYHDEFDRQEPFIRDEQALLSELLISLHRVKPFYMYLYKLIVYHIRPVGIVHYEDSIEES